MSAPAPCGLTVVEAAAPHIIMAKCWNADGTCEAYGRARRVNLSAVPLDGLPAIAAVLRDLAGNPRRAVLRGAIADTARVQRVRRLLHTDRKAGEAPTLLDVPRRWVAFDFDGVPLPGGCDPRDLVRCGAHLRALLPPAFHGAASVAQATASHAIKPGARLRLWCWLSRSTTGSELKRWLAGFPVDASAFGAAQPIYTATPIFDGCTDPLAERLAMLPGSDAASVPAPALLAPPPPRPPRPMPPRGGEADDPLAWAVREIGRQPEGTRHLTAASLAAWLAGLARAGTVPTSGIAPAIAAGIEKAGKPREEGEAIAAWALDREGLGR
jgi:hypothetical protein